MEAEMMFEFELCGECGGDLQHHKILQDFPFEGTSFARCLYGRSDDGSLHPEILAYLKKEDPDHPLLTESKTNTRHEIVKHMARAFFATAWADWAEEHGTGLTGMGVDVMDEMPEDVDPSAVYAAFGLCSEMEDQHGMPLADIFTKAVELSGDDGDREKSPEMFGHYAAMGYMGHGVSLHDALGTTAACWVDVPYGEFSYFELDAERYPIPAD